MKLRLPRFLRFRETQQDIDAALHACAVMSGVLDGAYIRRDEHDQRVRDLLDCNNRELQRRRDAESECKHLEREIARAIQKAHENAGLAKAVDWLKDHSRHVTTLGRDLVFETLASFVAGFTGRTLPPSSHEECWLAFEAGVSARAKNIALQSAAQSVGLVLASPH